MKRMRQSIALLLAAVLLLGGCKTRCPEEAPKETTQGESAANNPTVRGEMAKLSAEEGNWNNLTQEQMGEDAQYLRKILAENFPYYEVIQRRTCVDMEAEFAACLKEIEGCKTDSQFYLALDHWLEKAQGLGHLSLFQPGMYAAAAQIYLEDAQNAAYEDELDRQRMADVYNDPKAKECYEKLGKIMDPLFERVNAYYAALEPEGETGGEPEEQWQNIETKIIEPGKIAYIAIYGLDSTRQEEDRKILFDFYNQVKAYDHVIFDFTQNGGGSMNYFDELVVAPNISQPLEVSVYAFLMAGEYNRSFFDTGAWSPVSALPTLARMNGDDLKALDYYADAPYRVEPSGEKMLQGKLWLLVGPNVFSSSEYAAMLSKATGFMTLVGTTTGGDGIGFDPLPVVLPNSGLLVRYSAIYGTTADGVSSQEWGTEPDIVSPSGEEALDTCLKEIAKLSSK